MCVTYMCVGDVCMSCGFRHREAADPRVRASVSVYNAPPPNNDVHDNDGMSIGTMFRMDGSVGVDIVGELPMEQR